MCKISSTDELDPLGTLSKEFIKDYLNIGYEHSLKENLVKSMQEYIMRAMFPRLPFPDGPYNPVFFVDNYIQTLRRISSGETDLSMKSEIIPFLTLTSSIDVIYELAKLAISKTDYTLCLNLRDLDDGVFSQESDRPVREAPSETRCDKQRAKEFLLGIVEFYWEAK